MYERLARHELTPGKHRLEEHHPAQGGFGIGKTTLSQRFYADHPEAARPPLFSAGASWEELASGAHEEEQEQEREEEQGEQRDPVDAQLAHLEAGDSDGDSLEEPAGGAPAQAEASPAEEAKALAPPSLAALPVRQPGEDDDDDDDSRTAADTRTLAAADKDEEEDEDEDTHGAPKAVAAQARRSGLAGGSKARSKKGGRKNGKKRGQKNGNKNAPGPHDEPYEKNGLPLKKYLGAYDEYNVRSIKSNPKDPKRPGPQKTYTVNPDPSNPQAPRERYRIVGANTVNPDAGIAGDGTQVAHADLVPVGAQVALNVSAVRMLPVNGTSVPCVLTWFGVQGSAWMPISSLADDAKEAAEIQSSVNRLAKKWSPKIAPTSKLRRYTFALEGNPIATGEPSFDSQHYILGGQSGPRNTVNHYLLRKGEDREGNSRVYYNVCMNLPQHDAPPVASDVAKPGDYFFTPKDPKFKRDSSIFRAGKSKSTRVLVWVYGFLGKEQNGTIVADTSRRGWVTMRVLVPAP